MPSLKALESRDLYTVAWISALPLERAAAIAILDEQHGKPLDFEQPRSDKNAYTWGRIGKHNVAIASLPAGIYGTTSSAATALPMLSSFPQIRFGLLVGIGAGIARPDQDRDIRLGDIVVSQPTGRNGGVIQYDLGKAKVGNQRERKDFLNMPPQVLLSALGSLQARHEYEPSQVSGILESMVKRYPKLASAKHGYRHQGLENDRLFKSSCEHAQGVDCSSCDPNEEIKREVRGSTEPEVHYGTIASGNTLVKDAIIRDKIVKDVDEGCICFEMEAAGLMNSFPCLVIRGICDYADSHKNNRWQRYAAATAAAYAKEFLGCVPSEDLQKAQKAVDILEDIREIVADIHSGTIGTGVKVENLSLDYYLSKINRWIRPSDPSTNLNNSKKIRHEGTGSWFLESRAFNEWESGRRRHLWLHGIPGCGKTILCSTIIDHLLKQDTQRIVLYFFFDFSNSNKLSLDDLLRSLIFKLSKHCKDSQMELDKLFESCNNGECQPETRELSTTFQQMMNHANKTQIVIDAIDECKTREELLSWIEEFLSSSNSDFNLLATSRIEEEIESEIKHWLNQNDFIFIQQEAVNNDIRSYIRKQLQERAFERWWNKPSVQDMIETTIMKKADGMFKLATCQVDILKGCVHLRTLRETLASMPVKIEDMYSKILEDIDSKAHREDAIRILQILTFSERPLTINEVVDAITVDLTADTPFDPELRTPIPREIIKICSSLVSVVTRQVSQGERSREGNSVDEVIEFDVNSEDDESNEDDDEGSEYDVNSEDDEGNEDDEDSKDNKDSLESLKDVIEVKEVIVLQLAHLSVKEFLTSGGAEKIFPKVFIENTARGSITRVCLAYLSHLDGQRPISEITAEFAFARYSAQYWMDHARPAETEKDVQESILDFLLQKRQAYAIWGKLFDPDHPWDEKPEYYNTMPTPLYYVSLAGLLHTVNSLIEKGADVNIKGGAYSNPLYAASSMGHDKVVQLLLDRGANFNEPHEYTSYLNRSKHAPRPLHAASSNGHEKVVSLLLDKGVNIDQYGGSNECHAICVAYIHDREKVVQLLLDRGADVDAWGPDKDHIILSAAERGDEKMVQLLLAKGADFSQASMYGGPLYLSSLRGHAGVVKLLCDSHKYVSEWGALYGNALQAASQGGYDDVVQLLLDNEADVNAIGGYHGNALQAASSQGHEKIVQLLLDNGANVNAQVGGYCSDTDEGVIRILEDGSIDNPQGCVFDNALQAASLQGNENIVRLLLDNGANVNMQGGFYGSALQAAATKGHLAVVQLLLDKGADANLQGGKYQNSLHTASFGGYKKIVQLLLQKGAEINKQGGFFGNALQAAASQGHKGVVQLLLKNGADVNAEGGRYKHALRAAQLQGHERVAEMLLKNGAGAEHGAKVNSRGHFLDERRPRQQWFEVWDGDRLISRRKR